MISLLNIGMINVFSFLIKFKDVVIFIITLMITPLSNKIKTANWLCNGFMKYYIVEVVIQEDMKIVFCF
jgi:hypothetical protein